MISAPSARDVLGQDAFHRAIGADRHERGRFHGAARESQAAAAGDAVGAQQFEGHAAHAAMPSCATESI